MQINSKKIADVLGSHSEILFAYIYGSMARGMTHKKSDVDIGIFLEKSFNPEPLYGEEIAEEIERSAGLQNVEVVVLNGKPLRFLNQVLRYGKLVFSRAEKARVGFETYVTKAYIDFLPHYLEYDRKRLEA